MPKQGVAIFVMLLFLTVLIGHAQQPSDQLLYRSFASVYQEYQEQRQELTSLQFTLWFKQWTEELTGQQVQWWGEVLDAREAEGGIQIDIQPVPDQNLYLYLKLPMDRIEEALEQEKGAFITFRGAISQIQREPFAITLTDVGFVDVSPEVSQVLKRLLNVSEGPTARIRTAAAQGLVDLLYSDVTFSEPTALVLLNALRNPEVAVRVVAAEALHDLVGYLEYVESPSLPSEVLSALIQALEDPEEAVVVAAAKALAASVDPRTTKDTRTRVFSSLRRIFTLETKTRRVYRREAIVALGEIGPDAQYALPTLVEALLDPVASQAAINALVKIGPHAKEAVPVLVEALQDQDADASLRRQAAYALGRIGPAARNAIPALTEALQDENERVRQAAAEALKKIRGE